MLNKYRSKININKYIYNLHRKLQRSDKEIRKYWCSLPNVSVNAAFSSFDDCVYIYQIKKHKYYNKTFNNFPKNYIHTKLFIFEIVQVNRKNFTAQSNNNNKIEIHT